VDLAEAEIRFVLGARCLWSAKRDLVSVGWSLSDILVSSHVQRPDLPATADGYRFQSIPADRLPSVVSNPGLIAGRRSFILAITSTCLQGMTAISPSDRGVEVRTCARPSLVEQGRQFGITTDEDLRRHEGVIASTASHFVTNPPFDKRSQTGYR
jgi:nucleoside phosphorylase